MSKFNCITEDVEQEIVGRTEDALKPPLPLEILDPNELAAELKSIGEGWRANVIQQSLTSIQQVMTQYVAMIGLILGALDIDADQVQKDIENRDIPGIIDKLKGDDDA